MHSTDFQGCESYACVSGWLGSPDLGCFQTPERPRSQAACIGRTSTQYFSLAAAHFLQYADSLFPDHADVCAACR